MAAQTKPAQTVEDRKYILAHLPDGTKRVQIIDAQGKQRYKHAADVDVVNDEINLSLEGLPVVMRGNPGRRPKNLLAPVTPQIAEVSQAREDHLEASPLMREIKKNTGADAVMDAVLVGMSEEAAQIEFERIEAHRHGRGEDAANLAAKRARILKALADILIKRKQVGEGGMIDLDAPSFQALFLFQMETFKAAMRKSGCRSEQVEQTFTHLVGSLDLDWKEEARARMREKTK